MMTRCTRCATAFVVVCALWITPPFTKRLCAKSVSITQAENRFPNQGQGNIPRPAADLVPQIDAPRPSESEATSGQEGIEVLMRGPLHEAFASVPQNDPKPSPIVDQRPPEPIEESVPDFRPEGSNVQWIGGYWAWDDSADQFIWISGLWRDIPAGQRFVPGYWDEVDSGYRWVSGFWTSAENNELSYLPEPPESLDVGPSYAAPGDGYFYTPGHWVYQHTAYQWSPGYWQPYVHDRVWIPSRYVWTPRGFVYCRGYWDQLFDVRAVAFAPVRFTSPIYLRPHYAYRPWCRIHTGVNFYVHLFVRPSCGQYYFGDWYGDYYSRRGFCSWSHYPIKYRGYDPHYSYYQCSRAEYQNVSFVSWVSDRHRECDDHSDYRPHHIYRNHNDHDHDDDFADRGHSSRARRDLVDNIEHSARDLDLARNDRVASRDRPPVVRRISIEERDAARRALEPAREIQTARRRLEAEAAESERNPNRSGRTVGTDRRGGDGQVRLPLPQDPSVATPVPPLTTGEQRRFPANSRVDTDARNESRSRARTANRTWSPSENSSPVPDPAANGRSNRASDNTSKTNSETASNTTPNTTTSNERRREVTPPGRADRYRPPENKNDLAERSRVTESRPPASRSPDVARQSPRNERANSGAATRQVTPDRGPGLRTERAPSQERRSQPNSRADSQRSIQPRAPDNNRSTRAAPNRTNERSNSAASRQPERNNSAASRQADRGSREQAARAQAQRNNQPARQSKSTPPPRAERSKPNPDRSAQKNNNEAKRNDAQRNDSKRGG